MLVIRGQHALLGFQRRLGVAEALRSIGEDIAAQTDLDELLLRVTQHTRMLLGASYAIVVTTDQFGTLRHKATGITPAWDEDVWRDAGFMFKPDMAINMLRARKPVIVRDLQALPAPERETYARHVAEGARGILAVPIARGPEIMGTLVAGYTSARALTEEDTARAAALASQTAVAVENARLIEGLRQADRLKDEFVSAAAHELKTPVTTIKGYTEVLLRDCVHDERERAALESVCRQAERITRTTRDLLAAVRVRSGPEALRLERLDLSALARGSVEKTGRMTNEERLLLHAPEAILVEADARLIGDVVSRLLENAIRYSPADATVEVEARRSGRMAGVSVRDSGVGIPEERRPHVFEPFYEPVPVGEPGYVGLVSLGLFVSKQVVDAHGGRIWFESNPGKGSTFSFSLPLATP